MCIEIFVNCNSQRKQLERDFISEMRAEAVLFDSCTRVIGYQTFLSKCK